MGTSPGGERTFGIQQLTRQGARGLHRGTPRASEPPSGVRGQRRSPPCGGSSIPSSPSPPACSLLDLIRQHSRGWRRDRLKPFPELRFTYEEGEQAWPACLLPQAAAAHGPSRAPTTTTTPIQACTHRRRAALRLHICLHQLMPALLPYPESGSAHAALREQANASLASVPKLVVRSFRAAINSASLQHARPLTACCWHSCRGLSSAQWCMASTHACLPPHNNPLRFWLQRPTPRSSLCPMCGAWRWRRAASPSPWEPSHSLRPQVGAGLGGGTRAAGSRVVPLLRKSRSVDTACAEQRCASCTLGSSRL